MIAELGLVRAWLRARFPRRGESGQAAVEYAVMTASLLVSGTIAYPFLLKFAPDMMHALQIYVNGFYFVLSMPFP